MGDHFQGRPSRRIDRPLLQASVALGVMNDYEIGQAQDAIEMVKLGVTVQIREGSGA